MRFYAQKGISYFQCHLTHPAFAQELQEAQAGAVRYHADKHLLCHHTLWVQQALPSWGKKKNIPVTGISMPDNWQLYKTRFDYLSMKFPSSRVMQFWYQLLCLLGMVVLAWGVQKCACKVSAIADPGAPQSLASREGVQVSSCLRHMLSGKKAERSGVLV